MHTFSGIPITTEEFCRLKPQNVFFREIHRKEIDTSAHQNRHILFRKRFTVEKPFQKASIFISADDHYKLYLNGSFVAEGPAPAYHTRQNVCEIDVTAHLVRGDNILAVHTYYQGLINRVWQSGDCRHFLLFDLVLDGVPIIHSDTDVKYAYHSGYRAIGTVGYDTGFLTEFDARAAEVGFEKQDFDDRAWQFAKRYETFDQILVPQSTEQLVYETILPQEKKQNGNTVFLDFGKIYAGGLSVSVRGKGGDAVIIRMAQELADGALRHHLRANCRYEERLLLRDGVSTYTPYDYFAFRYAEITLPEGAILTDAALIARHYPFTPQMPLKTAFCGTPLEEIWHLCLNTLKYGVQEAPLDCLEREKGFYLGDACYTSLTHALITGNDRMVRKLIDDAFASAFISDTLMCCLNASFMQEIAEFPLILVRLVLWHYRLTGDMDYLKENYSKVTALLDAYRRDYEQDFLLSRLDKWCVVEWPSGFRDGYDVDLTSGKICREPHAVMNAYYVNAIHAANRMAEALGYPLYRDEAPLVSAFLTAFYRKERRRFCDSVESEHASFLSNLFAYAYGLCPDADTEKEILSIILEKKPSSVSLFGAFVMLEGLVRHRELDAVKEMLLDTSAWRAMLKEGATVTMESWEKDKKWNTSLFHPTLSYAALFLADADLVRLLAD